MQGKAKAAKECVLSKDYMRAEHMRVLDLWREVVVREEGGRRFVYPSAGGSGR